MNSFEKVKNFLVELEYLIVNENAEEGVIIIDHQEEGIRNMILVCADPILIVEQHLAKIKNQSIDTYKMLLKKNRDIVHGALVLDETGENVIFRDTLQLENIDLNEIEATIESLSILLSEFTNQLMQIS